jgi:enoyl-CoA hydratase
MAAFNRMSVDLFALPKPTVAAILGHAVAGGCVLAICCRRRVIAEGRTFLGLNEVKLGVPVPRPAQCILRSIVGAHAGRKMVEEGDFFEPQAALLLGLVDGVAPPERVLADAVEKARTLAAMADPEVDVDPRRIEVVLAQIAEGAEEDEERFLDAWFSEETQRLLAEACELF